MDNEKARILILTNELMNEAVQQFDDYILGFFGSREEFEKVAHLYVIEEKPISSEGFPTTDPIQFCYEITYEYRIRKKTEEELADEQETKAIKSSQDLHPL